MYAGFFTLIFSYYVAVKDFFQRPVIYFGVSRVSAAARAIHSP